MKWTSLNDLREKYLSFFESKGHLRLPSFSLVPNNDKSLLLINSGMFNLGYLPGSGNKALTTKRETTLPAVQNAIEMLDHDGILLVAVYPGHQEGYEEGIMLREYFSTLSRFEMSISQFQIVNSPTSPYFFIVEKK